MIIDGDSAYVVLAGRRGECVGITAIDAADLPLLMSQRWHLGGRYVYGSDGTALHRAIKEAASGQEVDHRDGDPLNNRRDNLKVTDRLGNAQNLCREGRECDRNVYRGRGRWRVEIMVGGVIHRGGTFTRIEDARDAARNLRARVAPHANERRHA